MNSEEKKAIQIALEDKQANGLEEWYDEREKFVKGIYWADVGDEEMKGSARVARRSKSRLARENILFW